ncbi:Peptidyl-tRNA hydrolase, mitochondrial [Capsicum chinense]|uniref:peptidyl-tRNA hydrolase n=1 Tax=Capsicum annuum TaxID=4072 RepID=A0A1U8G1C4_CAPAN|nr:peptidyl-tRNA hydrolase, mitochondrial isoform X1 [Capsicum annuum]KAF3667153.1 Peptidyl-tRNA hydrolase, mitochondrial [Capsicum annuum]KAF3682437.1 Peptidyl-tRNA hydrolase, mitochondrial [Capsicum annuum]PHT86436.1 Peptidyl-tRNA hydrolase, mitochondrial [Capsicum annuum]PHU22440.1 Peptidyl-tRNA hydrolase, mitochondrial [Capsicum chinense]
MKVACAISSTASSAAVLCRCLFSSSAAKTLIPTSYWRSNTSASGSLYQIACSMTTSPAPQPEKPKPPPQPWLIVGLGNPGKRYAGTRHSVGFEMIDTIADAEGISMGSVSFKAQFGKGFIGDVPVMLAKPQTFMNASGESVGAIVSYYKIPLKQVLVVFDDLDLPFAKLRLLPKGGHGGHNGMRSIMKHLKGSRDFPRLRIGIGRPPGKMDPASFVLRAFNPQEREELDFTLQNGLETVRILVLEGFDKSATFVNSAKPLTV